MKRIAKFHKVSFEQFAKDWKDTFEQYSEEEIRNIYDSLKLPKRATTGSAGYDFYAPVDVTMKPGEIVKIPTGIRVEMEEGWVLKCYPRSGLGFKFRLQLNNTVGIIDSDYFFSDNEGHIFAKLTNDTREDKTIQIPAGTGFMQGIFVEYGITVDDDADAVSNILVNDYDIDISNIVNLAQEKRENDGLVMLVSIFLYGFIIVVSLIGVTNIFNTLTTSMELRSREFAMFRSIGMSGREFNRMIRLESIFYGSKSLIGGLILGNVLSYIIYLAQGSGSGMTYNIPVAAIIISVVAVILLIYFIMQYSLIKIKRQNIIETIRGIE